MYGPVKTLTKSAYQYTRLEQLEDRPSVAFCIFLFIMSKVVAVALVTVADVISVLDRLFFNVLGGKMAYIS